MMMNDFSVLSNALYIDLENLREIQKMMRRT